MGRGVRYTTGAMRMDRLRLTDSETNEAGRLVSLGREALQIKLKTADGGTHAGGWRMIM